MVGNNSKNAQQSLFPLQKVVKVASLALYTSHLVHSLVSSAFQPKAVPATLKSTTPFTLSSPLSFAS
ncbi:hypothetical protein HY637_03945 [Candidatus Woesearchaeota archaeon]|nr:hypothetical protein [Candidatus Woesearchaeota archaeon]